MPIVDITGLDATTLTLTIAALLTTGALAGLSAGLLGVGGGIVVIPAFYYLLDTLNMAEAMRMHMTIGTALAVMIPTGIVSARSHLRHQGVELDVLRRWGWLIGLGALLGASVATTVHGDTLTLSFAGFVLMVAFRMFRRPTPKIYRQGLPQGPIGKIIPLSIGGFCGLIGIGGGSINVPFLAACGYPIRQAVGTSAAISAIIAIPAALIFILAGVGEPNRPPLSLGYANLAGVLLIAPTSLLAAPYGAHLAHRIRPNLLIRLFALFMTVAALRMIYGAFG